MPLYFSERPYIHEGQNGVTWTLGRQLEKTSGNVLGGSVSPALLKQMFSERRVTFEKWLPTTSGHVGCAILRAVLSLTSGSRPRVRSLAELPVHSSSVQHGRPAWKRTARPGRRRERSLSGRRKTGRALKAAAADASFPRGLESSGK